MKILRFVIPAALALAGAGAAAAGELKPAHGLSVDLGRVSGTAYYLVEDAGYRVVTTLAANDGEASPVRFETVLAPGQRVSLSTPREWGHDAEAIEIQRVDDSIVVRKASTAMY